LERRENDISQINQSRSGLRIFASLTVIRPNVYSTALGRRRVFTQPKPKINIVVIADARGKGIGLSGASCQWDVPKSPLIDLVAAPMPSAGITSDL
jgi:hypothetical protein